MVTPLRPKRGRRYWLRLLAFFLTIIVVLPLLIVLITANATAVSYVVPAHTTVVRPRDLPLNTQDVSFVGGDNLTLRGWYIPPQNGTIILLLHGYFSDRTSMVFQAHYLTQAGYGVLLYDERGAGESDGSQR
ncbi:MAG: alpha/beta hydrolase, partial [Chloroflexota bacterium]